jgi:hypothetical protein
VKNTVFQLIIIVPVDRPRIKYKSCHGDHFTISNHKYLVHSFVQRFIKTAADLYNYQFHQFFHAALATLNWEAFMHIFHTMTY